MAKLNFVKFKKPSKTAVVLVSPSRVLRAPGTSPYHLVPKHLRATWPRPEQSHLLPEACSPNGTDNRQQRQRRTKRPPPEPSGILKRFYALYDDKLRYYMKKVFKLNCVLNPFLPTVPQVEHSILAKIAKKFGQKWVKICITDIEESNRQPVCCNMRTACTKTRRLAVQSACSSWNLRVDVWRKPRMRQF